MRLKDLMQVTNAKIVVWGVEGNKSPQVIAKAGFFDEGSLWADVMDEYGAMEVIWFALNGEDEQLEVYVEL